MSTIADYFGRTYDLVAFHGDTAAGVARLDPAVGDPEGEVCTGIKKLSQRFVAELMTERGSFPLQPNRGTGFLQAVRRARNDADVSLAFSLAIPQVEATLFAAELATDPPDERFASAVIQQVVVYPRLVQLSIVLTTVAGSSRAVILPIATLP